MESFKYINIVCFSIVRYHINVVCSYLDIRLPIWLLKWQWKPNTIWTLLQKEKESTLFTIGFGIWMTIIVGKKWNVENIELLQMHAYIKVLDVKKMLCVRACSLVVCHLLRNGKRPPWLDYWENLIIPATSNWRQISPA